MWQAVETGIVILLFSCMLSYLFEVGDKVISRDKDEQRSRQV